MNPHSISEYRDQLRQLLKNIQAPVPIYYLVSEYGAFEAKSFFRLPQPGMIAWLQYRHQIDLSKSVFVTEHLSGLDRLSAHCGVKYIAAQHFFEMSGWDVSTKMFDRFTYPSLLRALEI